MKGFKFPPIMTVATIWVVWLFLAIGALGGAFFVLLDAFHATAEAAAWVQAFGSIAAILGAFLVAQHTHQLEKKTRSDEVIQAEIDALHFAESAAYEAYSSVNQAAGFAMSAPYMIGLGRLEGVQHTLRGLANRPLPADAFSSIFIVQEHVSDALRTAERVKKNYEIASYQSQSDIQELDYRRDELASARKTIAVLYWRKATAAGVAFQRRSEDQEHDTSIDMQ